MRWAAAWDGTCFTTVRQWVCDIEIRGWCPETPPPPDSACRRSTRSAYGRLGVSSDPLTHHGRIWPPRPHCPILSSRWGRYWRSDESQEFSRSTGREEQRSRQHQVARDGRASRRLRQNELIPEILSGRAGKRNQAHLGGQRLKIGQKNQKVDGRPSVRTRPPDPIDTSNGTETMSDCSNWSLYADTYYLESLPLWLS